MQNDIQAQRKRADEWEKQRDRREGSVAHASRRSRGVVRRLWFVGCALLFALGLVLLFPPIASAHATLLRSDPAQDAVLATPPRVVRMWFSEDLNPTFTTATVVNAQSQRVDRHDAHVSPADTKEMDLTLAPNLSPAVYIVVYRTHSADDGHSLTDSFIFTVARPDGSVPTLSPGQGSGVNILGAGALTGSASGQFDGPAVFTLIVTTLVELAAVFWVGAQFWSAFVLPRAAKIHAEERPLNERVARSFELRFSLPLLLLLLLANMGVLISQALGITGGKWTEVFSPSLLTELVTTGRFGVYWITRGIIILIALVLTRVLAWRAQHNRSAIRGLYLVNLLLGILLLLAISLSGHAAAVDNNVLVLSVLIDWLHLVAAALWVGGMFYIATTYLPLLRSLPLPEQTRSLLSVIPCFSPFAIAGVLLMSITGPFSATVRLSSWDQFLLTAYGRTLLVKMLLVGGLLLTSAYHVGFVRPRLRKAYAKYLFATKRLQAAQVATSTLPRAVASGVSTETSIATEAEFDHKTRRIGREVRQREKRITKQTHHLIGVLRYEPLLGVAVLVCVGLLNVFGGTLASSAAVSSAQVHEMSLMSQPFAVTTHTTDGQFMVIFGVNPDRFGTNEFVVRVLNGRTYALARNIGVALYTTMLGMEMGTSNINLLPDGKGYFRGKGDLTMSGRWQIRIQIRAPDNTLHEATTTFSTF